MKKGSMTFFKIGMVLWLYLYTTALAQAQGSYIAIKAPDDGRFSAEFGSTNPKATSSGNVSRDDIRFFDTIELKLEWVALLGQPVEFYHFKWKISDAIPLTDQYKFKYLRRRDVRKYPDLLSRYNRLKPLDLSLKFDVSLYPDEDLIFSEKVTGHSFLCDKKVVRYNPRNKYLDCIGDGAIKVSKSVHRVPHLMIENSGKWGDNITGVSPKNTRSFVNWPWKHTKFYGKCLDSATDAADKEKCAKATLNATKEMGFRNLSIEKLVLPIEEMNSIYEDLQERKKNNKDTSEDADSGKQEAEDDFWASAVGDQDRTEAELTEVSENNSTEDDFWSEDDRVEEDFWAGNGSIAEEVELEKELALGSGHQFLGHVKVASSYIDVEVVDHGGVVDGDRVQILLNDNVYERSITLEAYWKSHRIPLQSGINRLSFKALNEGSAPPNTAKFHILSDGKEIYSNSYSVDTDFTATLVVVRG